MLEEIRDEFKPKEDWEKKRLGTLYDHFEIDPETKKIGGNP
jgi:hypothetical protein